jgi:hypothetical protein
LLLRYPDDVDGLYDAMMVFAIPSIAGYPDEDERPDDDRRHAFPGGYLFIYKHVVAK